MKNIFEYADLIKQPPVKNAINQFKSYNTIRRDFRNAYQIVSDCIDIESRIQADNEFLETIKSQIHLYQSALMHAVNLYARWFKSTTGKPTLNINHFLSNPVDSNTHQQIIEIRDKYLAHNEMGLLGEDRVLVSFDDSLQVDSIKSDFLDKLFFNYKGITLQHFLTCIKTIHNQIDAKILPEKEEKLKVLLNQANLLQK